MSRRIRAATDARGPAVLGGFAAPALAARPPPTRALVDRPARARSSHHQRRRRIAARPRSDGLVRGAPVRASRARALDRRPLRARGLHARRRRAAPTARRRGERPPAGDELRARGRSRSSRSSSDAPAAASARSAYAGSPPPARRAAPESGPRRDPVRDLRWCRDRARTPPRAAPRPPARAPSSASE